MSTEADRVTEIALSLSPSERAELAGRLIESLDPDADDDYVPAWSAEIARRIEELESGSVQAIPWPEARRMIVELADDTSGD